jgi:glycosyltransferase involved in cell wall biosynthesis
MACGLPVVVSRLPVLERVLQHGENGLFVPIGDVGALRDSILTLSGNPELAERLSHNARRYVEQSHSFAVWQSQLAEFYRGLLR